MFQSYQFVLNNWMDWNNINNNNNNNRNVYNTNECKIFFCCCKVSLALWFTFYELSSESMEMIKHFNH